MSIQYTSVWNVVWTDEDNNQNSGTALFADRELAQAYIDRMLAPMNDGNTYEANEQFVVTEL
jgi:hypothetical protein